MDSTTTIGNSFTHVLYLVYILLVILIPFALLYALIHLWLRYKRKNFLLKQKCVLLELKLPKEITKSPAAMELVFTALHQTGAATYLETYWDGKLRPTFSFELVSLEGKVKFFIWTRATFKNLIETQIYAQYPNVEIYEVPDYTTVLEDNRQHMIMWGTYFKKKEAEVYPIKTYIDYGLDADPKEEFKIDPMTSVLEYLGSLRKDEYAWIQIIIQAHKKEGVKEGRIFQNAKPHWKDEVKKAVKEVREENKSDDAEAKSFSALTKSQQEKITTMERNLGKFPFESCIRGIYFSKAEIFNSNLGITGLIGSFRQYSSANLNSLSLGWFTDHEDFGKDMTTIFGWISPFKNYMKRKRRRMENHMIEGYVNREAFEAPFTDHHKPFILTTEELATIYHFPGNVVSTPTFDRIMAKKSEAPSNLPI